MVARGLSWAPIPWPRADGATAGSRTSGRAGVIDPRLYEPAPGVTVKGFRLGLEAGD
jgi:hypothetical protein